MWEAVARAAEADSGASLLAAARRRRHRVLPDLAVRRPGRPARASGSASRPDGGTTPGSVARRRRCWCRSTAARIARGELDVALVVGAEALDTQRRYKKRGERYPYSFKPDVRPEFPWEAPFHPAEVAHEVFQAWLTFALFDNARRGRPRHRARRVPARAGGAVAPLHRGRGREPARRGSRSSGAPPRSSRRRPTTGMVASPYTKYMVSIMDVDMAAAVFLVAEETADALGIPRDRRVYPRGWQYATDPVYVAEHPDLASSPAMRDRGRRPRSTQAGVGIDDVAHLDLYSCFGSSVNFMRDALGIGADDARPLTVTGGLPYHGGAGSDYLTHAIAQMARVLRADPGAVGLVTGVGMHMTKHVAGVYSIDARAGRAAGRRRPAPATVPIVDRRRGPGGRGHAHGRSTAGRARPSGAWRCAISPVTTAPAATRGSRTPTCSPTPWRPSGPAARSRLAPHPSREGANLVVA